MVGRVILLIAAFVVAALGALLVYLYAEQADERAAAESSRRRPRHHPGRPRRHHRGRSGRGRLVSSSVRPAAALPDGYLSDTARAARRWSCSSTLYRSEVLIEQKVGIPRQLAMAAFFFFFLCVPGSAYCCRRIGCMCL